MATQSTWAFILGILVVVLCIWAVCIAPAQRAEHGGGSGPVIEAAQERSGGQYGGK